MSFVEQVRMAGVVGAGGGGFPAHVKLSGKADTLIANGAECEPLLHKDAVIMERSAAALVRGMRLSMDAVGARDAVIGIKSKKKHAVAAVMDACAGTPVRVHLLGDYYPAGDEYDLVYEVTGRLIPPGGIPLQVGAVVQNVETFVNIALAAEGVPVTTKMLTVAGAVNRPATLSVPIGTSFGDCISAAGGLATGDPVLCVGGLMMGQVTDDLDAPVTKTVTGLVVLPRSHPLIQRKLHPAPAQARIGKSACDQCRYCTEFCPRYLLGYAVEPHQVMRSLAFTGTGEAHWNQFAALCCACGLCTLFACPEQLFPKEACDASKVAMRNAGQKWAGPTPTHAHPIRDGRHVPIPTLTRRLNVEQYDDPAAFDPVEVRSHVLTLPLKQSAGAACVPVVKEGDRVTARQLIAAPPEKALGANLHSPVSGVVGRIDCGNIWIQNGE